MPKKTEKICTCACPEGLRWAGYHAENLCMCECHKDDDKSLAEDLRNGSADE